MKSRKTRNSTENGSRNGSANGFIDGSRKSENSGQEPIAIIGIGCRYSGASNAAELWQVLTTGAETVGPYPGGRFAELDSLYEEARRKPGRVLTDRGGFLADIAGFDSQFFGISPRESLYMDPQHRLLLEVGLEALEDAGQVRDSYEESSTGVYVGLWTSEYENRLYQSGSESDFYSVTGCERASASGRLSFAFGLQGPSVTVDTACSSSLVAVHMACQALRAGEMEMALAGGANLILGPEISELFTRAKMLSPEGSCKFGDASANGFVRSEGAGIIVLKRLSQALADNDPIYALIRGGAVNNDGHSSNFLTPSQDGQQQMLRAAWRSADVDPKAIRYIEMHGTGTNVGDPVEIGAAGSVLAESGVTRACMLGSVKTNLGHTESASGVTGLIKAVLALRHRTIPPSLHFTVPNPKIAWDEIPVKIATESVDLSMEAGPILAGVNSFGLSGTNAHIVLEEMVQTGFESTQAKGPYLLPISARSPEALHALLVEHLAVMESAGERYPIRDVCYTASARRTHHEYRSAIVGENLLDLAANLASAVAGEGCDGVASGRIGSSENKTVFVAPGQGSQWIGMARELFESNSEFRHAFEQCDSAIASETGWRLSSRILGPDAELYLSQIDVIQPALFTMSVALAAAWRGFGIEPDVVVGHSMGEVAAAHIAGILNLEDAVAVICRRSRLMKTIRGAGSMATVELPLHEVEALLESRDGVFVGASNGPHTTVISGDSKGIEALLKELEAKEIYCRQIKVDVASHSAQVDPILAELFSALSEIRPQPAKIPMLSTVTGEYATRDGQPGVVMDAAYWVENLRRSVLFAPAIEKLAREGHDTFVELSPHPILLPSIEATAREENPRAVAVASLRREKPESATLLSGLAALYAAGRAVAWQKLYPNDEVRCVPLPQYPFQRERCWPEPADPARAHYARHASGASPLLGRRFESSLQPDTLLWETLLDLDVLPYLNDHRVLRSAIFPASGHVEIALSAAKAARPDQTFEVRNALFLNAAYLPDKGRKTFQVALIPDGEDVFRFEIRGHTDQAESQAEGRGEDARQDKGEATWTLYSSGVVAAIQSDPTTSSLMPIEELKSRSQFHCNRQEQYEKLARSGLNYGPAFQLAEESWAGDAESLSRIRFDAGEDPGYAIHPALLDACFQAITHLWRELDGFNAEDTYLPVVIERVRIPGAIPLAGDLFAHATLVASDPLTGTLLANLRLADADGNILVEVTGMEVKRVARESLPGADDPLYTLDWIAEKPQGGTEQSIALPSKASAENWLVFADDTGIAAAMKESLLLAGGRCTLVRPGSEFLKTAAMDFEIDPGKRKDLDRLLEEVSASTGVPTAIVHLWTLNHNSTAEYDVDRLVESQAFGSQYVPGIVQAITALNWQNPPRLWLVTAGAMAVRQGELARIENAPMWGMGRVAAREHTELRPALIDLSFAPDRSKPDLREAQALALMICVNDKEDRIALRGGDKYVARFNHFSAPVAEPVSHALAEGENYRLEISATGILDNLELRAFDQASPASGEVLLDVAAAGLNFIDVTKVMGILPGLDPSQPIRLGMECSGRVTAVGKGVNGIEVGEEVIAITPSMRTTSLAGSTVSVPAEMVLRKPAHLSFDEAATTSIAFLTAYYSLIELARVREGEWVLIHAAAGGVGLAAVEIAKWAGAKIIATVGSEEKADHLRSMGVRHILNSRSLDFARGVMEITEGRGVDVVLNSLAGEFISKGLEVLAPYGRFVELGKRDIYDDRNVGLKVFRKNLSFHAVDLAAALEERRAYVMELLHVVMRHIESGEWKPLPVTSFSSSEPAVPFRYMAQARHIGRISIRMDREVSVLPATGGQIFSSHSSYLITGGLGGVALTVAEWMARNGAGNLVLLSRRAASEDSAAAIRRMEASGATVTTVRADVTSESDLVKVVNTIRASGYPLKGIMHTAAILDDALIADLPPGRVLPVMAPKMLGAWNLHTATIKEELDFFVLFSSISSVHPLPGTGSYAAANAFLDGFAHYRRALGKAAISVNWGVWDQIGLVKDAGVARSVKGYEQQGVRNLSAHEALAALGRALETKPVQAIAAPFDWDKFAEFHGANNAPPAFSDLISRARSGAGEISNRSEILDRMVAAESIEERREILETHLQEVLGSVLKLATHKIDRERPLGGMGLDSLMGLEFVRRMSNTLQIAVPATVVFNYPTIKLLATHLLRRMKLESKDDPAVAIEKPASLNGMKNGVLSELTAELSEEEALHALIGNGQRSS